MSDKPSSMPPSPPPASCTAAEAVVSTRPLVYAAAAFIVLAFLSIIGAFLMLFWPILSNMLITDRPLVPVQTIPPTEIIQGSAGKFLLFIVGGIFPQLLLIIFAVVCIMIAMKLLSSAGVQSQWTIPLRDYELVRDAVLNGKSEAIDQYIRLRALTGIAGGFTKIGLTGLPLTTIAMTVFFCLAAMLYQHTDYFTQFLDLGKLTLGAFIGSYVQKQVERSGPTTLADTKKDLPT